MKKLKGLFCIALALLAFTVISCGEEEAQAPVEEPIVELEGIDVSSYKKTIAVGETIELETKFKPENTTKKNLLWSSSDESILTVTDGKVTGLDEGIATVTASSLNGKIVNTLDFKVVNKAKWTVMLYICGSDLADFEESRVKELLKTENQPKDVNIIVETGGSKEWTSTFNFSKNKLQRYHVENHNLVLDESLTNRSMGSSSVFQDFMEWGLNEYPAEKTGVIFLTHGGAIKGVGSDSNYDKDRLTNGETQRALEAAFKNTRTTKKLEFVVYDSCVMALQDVAEYNSHFFKYMIANQDYSWATYEDTSLGRWAEKLYSGSNTLELMKSYLDQDYFNNTFSLLDLSYMEEYKIAWENMAVALDSKINQTNKAQFIELIRKTKCFGIVLDEDTYDPLNTAYGIYDAKDFIKNLSADATFNPGDEYTKPVMEAFDKVIIESRGNVEDSTNWDDIKNGMNMFWDISSICGGGLYTDSNTSFKNWLSLVKKYRYTEMYQ